MERRSSRNSLSSNPSAEVLYSLACAITETPHESPVRKWLTERFHCALSEERLRFLLSEPDISVHIAPSGNHVEIRLHESLIDAGARQRKLENMAASILELERHA